MKTTPKDFFLWFGALVAFYWSAIAFILLLFNYIDYAFADPLDYLPNPYSSGIPYEMASIVVLFPVALILFLFIRRDIASDMTRKDIWVRRWGLILTLFIAGISIVIDLITLLTLFFSGDEMTVSFLLKVLIVLLVAGGVFMHFIADYWGYWDRERKRERMVLAGVSILVLVSIISGFLIIGSPRTARLMRFDEQKVTDLQNIQWQIINYWQYKEVLPATLDDLKDSVGGYAAPVTPDTKQSYVYEVTGERSFTLCTDFSYPSQAGLRGRREVSPILYSDVRYPGDTKNWEHEAGYVCFERVVDPDLYPPVKLID